jgi:hypothetical protein
MDNQDLQAFIQAFDDFMKHFDAEELYHEGRKVYENHATKRTREIQKKAEKLNVSVDYYILEFI